MLFRKVTDHKYPSEVQEESSLYDKIVGVQGSGLCLVFPAGAVEESLLATAGPAGGRTCR